MVQVHVPPLGPKHTISWEGFGVKKFFVFALLVLGGFVAWQRYQARRADLDLWTEATTGDDF